MINGMGTPADVEKERAAIEREFAVRAIYSPAEMAEPREIADLISLGESTLGSVDVLVNNAGIQHVSPIEDFPIDKRDSIIAIKALEKRDRARLLPGLCGTLRGSVHESPVRRQPHAQNG